MSAARRWLGLAAGAIGGGLLLQGAAERWYNATVERLTLGSRLAGTANGPVEYAVVGAGAPVLVAHGTPGGYDQALVIADLLAGLPVQVVAPSRPGYLRTPLASGQTFEQQADLFAALLDHLGLDRVVMLGASGGGPSAVQFALRYPQRVTCLVLWEAVTARMPLDVRGITQGPVTWKVTGWLVTRLMRARPGLFLPAAIANDPDRLAVALTLVETTFPLDIRREGTLNDARWVTTLPGLPLHAVSVPTLLLHGTKDANVPPAQSVAAAAAIPGARFVSVEGGDHATTLFLPQAADALREFIQRHLAPRPSP